MVKLDANVLRYMTRDEWRVLTAVEMGMKNHDLVPTTLIQRIAGLQRGGAFKVINSLHKNKLIVHENKKCKWPPVPHHTAPRPFARASHVMRFYKYKKSRLTKDVDSLVPV